MSPSLGLSSTVEVFPCPACRETINTSVSQCPRCSTPIDPAAAQVAAAATTRISQAISDASYLKIMAGAALTCFLAALFLPFISIAAIFGFRFLELAVPFLSARWWIRFGSIATDDPDFAGAKRIAMWTAIGSGVLLATTIVLTIIFRRLVP